MMTVIDILDALSPTEVIVKCGFCRGGGSLTFEQLQEQPPDACPICDGKGKVLIKAEHLPLVVCARCHGTGSTFQLLKVNKREIEKLIDQVCSSCNGAGCQALVGNWEIVKTYPTYKAKLPKGPTIHLTGLTVTQFEDAVNNKENLARCFICQRSHGQESIALTDEAKAIVAPVEILKYEKRFKDVAYTFPICKECAWLVGLLS